MKKSRPEAKKKKELKTSEFEFPIVAELVPHGDGTYGLKPSQVPTGLDQWISVRKAAKMIGIDWRSTYRLLHPARPYLVHKRPLKRRVLISLKSVLAYIQATNHPDFWSDRLQQNLLSRSVQDAQKLLFWPQTTNPIVTKPKLSNALRKSHTKNKPKR